MNWDPWHQGFKIPQVRAVKMAQQIKVPAAKSSEWPEFDALDPHDGRKELALAGCPLTSKTAHIHTHYTHTEMHTQNK